MPHTFDTPAWKARVAAWWQQTGRDVQSAMNRLGVQSAYGLLTASAFLPLLEIYGETPGPAMKTLVELVGGVGGNLIANIVQGVYDQSPAPRQIEREIAEQPELRAEYQQLLTELDALEAARAALGDEWSAFDAQLRAELAQMGGGLRVEAGGDIIAGGGIFFGTVKVKGNFAARDYYEQHDHYHAAPPPPDFTPQREAYLRHVAERTSRLPLRGVDVGAGDPTHSTRPRLAQVYVDLDTTIRVGGEELESALAGVKVPWSFDTNAEQPQVKYLMTIEFLGRGGYKDEPLPILIAVVASRFTVLLGDPGSGKSTFVNHLAYCLTMHALEPEADWLEHLSGWPADETDLLPVVVTLRDFARWAAAQPPETEPTVGHFLERWLTGRDLSDFAEPLCRQLRAGQAIVFFDGLDEIPTGTQRAFVRDAVATFARTYGEARIVVTCRTLSYQDPDWQLPHKEFPAFELAPFTEEKIARFIAAWYHELAGLGAVRLAEVETLIARLQAAVQRPDIARLAPNPLLLTVMALVHAYRGRLPEARALLYEECTDLLLWRWEGLKAEGREAETAGLRRLLAEADLQDVDLKRTLWALAFTAHQGDGDNQEEGATADIAEATLWRALRQLHPSQSLDWADKVIRQIKERAGLLVEREPGIYTFPHRTFQEYLAGSHLSVQADFPQQAVARTGEAAFWREVVLLAVGRQVHVAGNLAQPLALVAELCPARCVDDDACWQRAWLAGEVLQETGLNRVRQGQQGRDLLARVQDRLCALVEGGHLAPRERAEVGDLLGRLGDPRFDADFFYLPRQYRGQPEPRRGFVKIPGGPFTMGEGDEAHPVDIPYDYWLARYPVTVAQYGCFVEDEGYETRAYWTATGWAWRQGEWDSQVESESLKRWLKQRPAELRGMPMWWVEQQRAPTRPVMGVSWFEAVAYTRWLAAQMTEEIPENYTVRLPTEAEWEKAASASPKLGSSSSLEELHACKRIYPWGNDDWTESRANIDKSQIGHANAVGMYPLGATPAGLHEMAGNVWEWMRTRYASYPYVLDDGREALDAEGSRVFRGGSWDLIERFARCAYRYRYDPDSFDYDNGFRVVVSLRRS